MTALKDKILKKIGLHTDSKEMEAAIASYADGVLKPVIETKPPLTKKQKDARAKEKRARQARKINRNK